MLPFKNVLEITLLILLSMFFIAPINAKANVDTMHIAAIAYSSKITNGNITTNRDSVATQNYSTKNPESLSSATTEKPMMDDLSLFVVFIIALIGGLFTVFTPYVYAFVPMTISTLIFRSTSREEGNKHTFFFSFFIVSIFTALGGLISVIFGSTGLHKLTANWIFNLFFCRFLAGLGLSMLGAFDIRLPMALIRATHSKAKSVSTGGLFFMALTLPVATFSSTFPLVGLILIMAGNGGILGPVAGMLGFSIGLASPFMYPRLINLMPASVLNYIKVLLGFILFFLGVKFFSNADIAKGWHILDREMFIFIWILLCTMLSLYMLGWVKFTNDYVPAQNIYGQEYVSLLRLFVAIAALTLAIYLLPGIWGAPLHGVNFFLPPVES